MMEDKLCTQAPNEFADAMRRMLSKKLRSAMSKAGPRHVNENFTNDAMTNQLENILIDTIDKKHDHVEIYTKKIYTQLR